MLQLSEYELTIATDIVDPLTLPISWKDIGGLREVIDEIKVRMNLKKIPRYTLWLTVTTKLKKYINNGETFSSRNSQKKNFLSPQWEPNPWPSRYRLDALTTELSDSWWARSYTRFLYMYVWHVSYHTARLGMWINDKWIGDLDIV